MADIVIIDVMVHVIVIIGKVALIELAVLYLAFSCGKKVIL